MLNAEQIRQTLMRVQDPELHQDIVSLGMVRDIVVEAGFVSITLALTTLACPLKEDIVEDVREAVTALDGELDVQVHLTEMTEEERRKAMQGHAQQGTAEHLNKVAHVLAIMSGKGGVGKSLVTGMLAVELARRGYRVGVLDADITGPSIPKIFGLTGRPLSGPVGIAPVRSKLGLSVMSINLLLPNEDDAVIWRGPLISGAVKQFWGDVFWGTLDYLLVDLPPGTADVPLTVMQSLPIDGIVLVTSPQDLAGMVVRKAAHMAAQLHKPILGVVENMSHAICPHCGERIDLFGPSHLSAICEPLRIPVLGRIPLDAQIATLCDQGQVEDCVVPAFTQITDLVLAQVPGTVSVSEAE